MEEEYKLIGEVISIHDGNYLVWMPFQEKPFLVKKDIGLRKATSNEDETFHEKEAEFWLRLLWVS